MFIGYPKMGRGVPENGYPSGKKMFIRYPKMGRGYPKMGTNTIQIIQDRINQYRVIVNYVDLKKLFH